MWVSPPKPLCFVRPWELMNIHLVVHRQDYSQKDKRSYVYNSIVMTKHVFLKFDNKIIKKQLKLKFMLVKSLSRPKMSPKYVYYLKITGITA